MSVSPEVQPLAGARASQPLIVIVHGLKGSHLRNKGCCCGLNLCCSRIYVNFWRLVSGALCGCGDQMKLPRRYDADGVQERDKIEADGAIADVRVCGCMKIMTMYSPLINVGKLTGATVKVFDYDWRRSPAEANEQLEAFIEAELAKHPGTQGAQVIAHSNGGMVTWPLVNRRPDLFHSLLLVAPAIAGNAAIMPDLSLATEPGNKVAFNKTMQTPSHWLSWPVVFYFFQTREQKMTGGRPPFAEADGTPVDVDLHRIEHWKEYQLGPYHPDSGVTMSDEDEQFLAETLRKAKDYRALFCHDEHVDYPPIGVLTSTCDERTVTTWRRPTPGEPFVLDRSEASADHPAAPLVTLGDGRIEATRADPPAGVPVHCRNSSADATHTSIATTMDMVVPLLTQLTAEADRRGKGSGSRTQ
jgi:pimeloyl-ACP methyl ester carboxylesterase